MADYDDISYCALYCGNCFIRMEVISDLARRVLDEFETVKFSRWAGELSHLVPEMKAFEKYRDCIDVLECWDTGMRCNKSCREGGGSAGCDIRRCCIENRFNGCWQCDAFETCDKLGRLEPLNGTQIIENIRRIKTDGMGGFIAGMKNKKYGDFYK